MVQGPMLLVILVVAIAFIVVMTAKVKMNAFLVLLLTALGTALAAGMEPAKAISTVTSGFGGLVTSVGLVIICGTIIGTFLQKSNATTTMANTVLKVIHRSKAALAMAITGVITSSTVFCDSGFIILNPLNKMLSKKTGISFTTMTVALSLGLYTSHCLIPPAAGPIAGTALLGLTDSIGFVIMYGIIIAIPTTAVVYFWAKWIGRKIPTEADVEIDANIDEKNLPSAEKAFTPILFPIVLIALRSIANFPGQPFGNGALRIFLDAIGTPNIAMLIGVFLAFRLMPKWSVEYLNGWVNEGIRNCSLILIITAAGGALGEVLRATQIGQYLGMSLAQFNLGIFLPFLIAAAMKIAQGSSTVAIITAASIVAPLMPSIGLTTPLAQCLCLSAIGAGAVVVSHANDSYFWVVTNFSGLDVNTVYKAHTAGTLIQGVTMMTIVFIISLFVV